MIFTSNRFTSVYAFDFEFIAKDGERHDPVCLVAWDVLSGRRIEVWRDHMTPTPPYIIGNDSLFLGFQVEAEMSCHIALGWPIPGNIVDLRVEYLHYRNPRRKGERTRLIDALKYFGIPGIHACEKDLFREKIMSGGPWTLEDRREITAYCWSDVKPLPLLYSKLNINLPQALLRGQYAAQSAQVRDNGIPLDIERYNLILEHREAIKQECVDKIGGGSGVYLGTTFKIKKFEELIESSGIPWPKTKKGNIKLDQQTFEKKVRLYPKLEAIKETRKVLSELSSFGLKVGLDGRNRSALMAFHTTTRRSQPTGSSILGLSRWIRGLIRPNPGTALVYLDWVGQEAAIAGVLSGDSNLIAAYESGDMYAWFGRRIGLIPPDGKKDTHPNERKLCKKLILGLNYGMGIYTLAQHTQKPLGEAKRLLKLHKQIFCRYWKWLQGVADFAYMNGYLKSVFGWTQKVKPGDANDRSVKNYLMQTNGAEMMAYAVCLASKSGVKVCASLHDAILIESDLSEVELSIRKTKIAMKSASRAVLKGYETKIDTKIIKYPERFNSGHETWNVVENYLVRNNLLQKQEVSPERSCKSKRCVLKKREARPAKPRPVAFYI